MDAVAQRLTDAELDRLEDFLHLSNPGEAMSVEELDGFFCALICGPELVPPSQYLPMVFGGELGQGRGFKTIKETQHHAAPSVRRLENIS
jgi:yecA family protein